jgi:hypothetical protein
MEDKLPPLNPCHFQINMPIEVIYVITLGIVVLYLTTIPSKRLRKSYQQFSFELDF